MNDGEGKEKKGAPTVRLLAYAVPRGLEQPPVLSGRTAYYPPRGKVFPAGRSSAKSLPFFLRHLWTARSNLSPDERALPPSTLWDRAPFFSPAGSASNWVGVIPLLHKTFRGATQNRPEIYLNVCRTHNRLVLQGIRGPRNKV